MAIFDFSFKSTANRVTKFFYKAHVSSVVSAVIITLYSLTEYLVENHSVGDFNLRITRTISYMNFFSVCVLLITVAIGYLALKRPDKSSLWVAYCIMLFVFAMVCFFGSISALTRARADKLVFTEMKHSMEFYADGNDNATKWDNLHEKYECCGVSEYKDWQDVRYGRTSLRVPKSCCRPVTKNDSLCGLNILPHDDKADEKIFARGCHGPALKTMRITLGLSSALGITISLVHNVLAIISCYLVIHKKV